MKLTKAERLVLEGQRVKLMCEERQVFAGQAGVVIDCVRATFQRARLNHLRCAFDGLSDSQAAHGVSVELAEMLGFKVGTLGRGRDHYAHSASVVNENGQTVAYASAGGDMQRGTLLVNVDGLGCTFAADGWERRLHEYLVQLDARITRVDLALDFFKGEFTVNDAVDCYKSGGFSYQNRAPLTDQQGDWINGHSRTFYVGRRASGKLCRIYEKGHKFGAMDDPWVRVEVELRNNERVIPLEALVRPAGYFAGAYEVCELLMSKVDPISIPRSKAVSANAGAALVRWVENTCAPALVALTRSTGTTDWINDLVWAHADRPVPRSIKGCQLDMAQVEIAKHLAKSLGASWGEAVSEDNVSDGEAPY